MARLIMWNLMTLDGFVEGPGRDISWHLDVWGEELEKLFDRKLRVENIGEHDLLGVQKVSQTLEHRRLSRPHFARQNDKPLTALHAVNQIGQRFFVLDAPVEKTRIRTQVERTFL